MYGQNFPMPSFPGGNYLPSTLDKVNPAHLAAIGDIVAQGGGVKSYYGHRMVDTIRLAAGTVTRSHSKKLFTKGKGERETLFNDGSLSYEKSGLDTNFDGTGNGLPSGHAFYAWSMQFIIEVSGSLPDSTYASGDLVTLTNVIGSQASLAAADPIMASHTILALRRYLTAALSVTNAKFENGPLGLFPSKSRVEGAGSSTGTVAQALNDFVLGNGGEAYTFPIIRGIDGQQKFNVEVKAESDFTLPCNVQITAVLEGLYEQPITG